MSAVEDLARAQDLVKIAQELEEALSAKQGKFAEAEAAKLAKFNEDAAARKAKFSDEVAAEVAKVKEAKREAAKATRAALKAMEDPKASDRPREPEPKGSKTIDAAAVLAHIASQADGTNGRDTAKALHATISSVRKAIGELEESGKIRRTGAKRSTRYFLA